MAVAETVVAAWVLIAGGVYLDHPKISAEFNSQRSCEHAASEMSRVFRTGFFDQKKNFNQQFFYICVPK